MIRGDATDRALDGNAADRGFDGAAHHGLMDLRTRLGAMVFAKVAGDDGPEHRDRIHLTPGERWFDDDAVIRRVHADSSMFIGGLRALLLQSLHPLAMAGVAGHSDYRGDPWGRLQRTSYFLAVTTFGVAEDAERAVAKVRGIHRRVQGEAADGRPYSASDPHLLEWVHIAEVDSFLRTHTLYGAQPLDADERDQYVAETAVVARKLGVPDPPTSEAALADRLAAYRPELRGTAEARAAARFLVVRPPLPLVVRPAYTVLASTAVATLPRWTRFPLRLPYLPVTERTVVRAAGKGIVGGLRWITTVPDPAALAATRAAG